MDLSLSFFSVLLILKLLSFRHNEVFGVFWGSLWFGFGFIFVYLFILNFAAFFPGLQCVLVGESAVCS